MTARHLACVAVCLAALAPGAAAEKPRPARPAGKDMQAEVMRGGSVRIPLRGFERNLNRLVYGVLQNPRHGRLTSLGQYDGPDRQGAGYITYTHGDDDDSAEDEFVFEVRAPATKLTGRGRVKIRIVDSPARLSAPAVLDFGRVAIGDPAARRRLELANIGGGVLQGSMEVPAPFALGGDGNFLLRRGRSTAIPVLFAPGRAGPYSSPIQPVRGDPATVILKGEAIPPFVVEAKGTDFSVTDGSRTLVATVVNHSQTRRDITVHLPANSPVERVAPLALAPGESREVVLRLPPQYKTGVPEFQVGFKDQDYEQVLALAAPPVPAKLVVVQAPDFGAILPRRIPRSTLVLRNEGGSVAEGRLQQSDIIVSADGTPAFRIEPGEQYAMPLELRLRPDTPPPTTGFLVFRGEELPFGITASMAAATPTPPPVVPPGPGPGVTPPPPPVWALGTDIQCTTAPEGLAIRWTEKPGWNNVILQHQPGTGASWQDYRLPAPRAGWFGWLQELPDKIRGFLDKPIERPTIEGLSGTEEKFGQTLIAADAPGGNDLWRLQAAASSSGEPRTVSAVFRIEKDRKLVAAAEQPEPAPPPVVAPSATPSAPTTSGARPHQRGPVTPIASAGIKAERHGALLQIAIPHDPSLRGFRLERGAMVSPLDPKTGIPSAPEFEPLAAPEAGVETIFFGEGEAGGRKLTLCTARIDGLPAGTRTYWRLIPAGPDRDLPPTTVLLVETLPEPPIPWSKILLVILFLLLAGVLYLRWKINRPPC